MEKPHEPIELGEEASKLSIMALAANSLLHDLSPLVSADESTLKTLAEAYGDMETRAGDIQRSIVEVIADLRFERKRAEEEARKSIEEAKRWAETPEGKASIEEHVRKARETWWNDGG